jgi:hypothetical protein
MNLKIDKWVTKALLGFLRSTMNSLKGGSINFLKEKIIIW